jgi:hypothetical protein
VEPQRLRFTTSTARQGGVDDAVAILAQHIAAQRYRVAELARRGRDTRRAKSVLQGLESRIADRIVERDRARGNTTFNPSNGRLGHA